MSQPQIGISLIFSSENKEFFVFGKNLDDIKKKIIDIKAATNIGLLDNHLGEKGILSALFGGRPNSVEELRSRLIVRERDLRSDFFMNEDAFSGFNENSARTLLATSGLSDSTNALTYSAPKKS